MKVLTIAGANLRRFVRDRSNVFFVFIMPIGIVLLIGAQFGGDFSPKLGVHLAGEGPVTVRLAEALDASEDITTVAYQSENDMLLAVERGTLSAGVSASTDLDAALAGGGTARVGFISRPDGLGPQLQTVVSAAVAIAIEEETAVRFATERGAVSGEASAAATVAAGSAADLEVETVTTGDSLFPSDMGQFDIGASSQLVLFMFLTGVTGAVALIQSRKYGVTTRMLGTPTSVASIIGGEALGRYAVVLVQGLYIVAATVIAFGVDWGDPIGVAVVMLAFAVVGAGAAMLFGTVFRNEQQVGGVGVLAGLGLAAIGGSMLPLELFSPTMERVARFTPHAWANDAFAELVRHDGTVVDVLPQVGVLLAFGVVLLALAAWRMRAVITRP